MQVDPSIVLYAGMPKAGSSSVQRWLGRNADWLRREHAITVAVAAPGREVEFVPYDELGDPPGADAHPETIAGSVNSGWVVEGAWSLPERADRFVASLRACAQAHGRIVVCGEAFAMPFAARERPDMMARLDELAATCELRVAYYARAQDASLEAAWRQWGFRFGGRPSAFLERWAVHLHYLRTARWVGEAAPHVSFELRRYDRGRFGAGGVIDDFAREFLGIDGAREDEGWVNRGLPLTVVNLLRNSPPGMFWRDIHDNGRLLRVKAAMEGCDADDDRIGLSRQVLRRYAYERFAAENAALGWDGLVPAPESGTPELEAINELWRPQASEGEQAAFMHLLRTVCLPDAMAAAPRDGPSRR